MEGNKKKILRHVRYKKGYHTLKIILEEVLKI